jgi:hypothetical protein
MSTYLPPSVLNNGRVDSTGGTISINNGYLGSGSIISPITSLGHLGSLAPTSKHVKKFMAVEIDDDLLALSVAWKRSMDSGKPSPYCTLLSDHLFDKVTVADRAEARTIREYYGKKVLMWTLKGVKLSKWRQDMSAFVNSDGRKFAEDVLGLVYKLPYFYQYDCQLDEFRQSLPIYSLNPLQIDSVGTKKLTPVIRINKDNKRVGHVVEYWFKDQSEVAVRITIERKNPLGHIWSRLFDEKQPLNIKAAFKVRKQDELDYYIAHKWELQYKEEK